MENSEIKLIKMVNSEGQVADVHPDEMLNYATGGYVTCESLLGNTEAQTPAAPEVDVVSEPTILIETPQEIIVQAPEEALTGTNPEEPTPSEVVLGEVQEIIAGN